MRYVLQQGLTTLHNCPYGMDGYYMYHILRLSQASCIYIDTDARYIRIIYDDTCSLHVSYKHLSLPALYHIMDNAAAWPAVYAAIKTQSAARKLALRAADNSYRQLGKQAAAIVHYISRVQSRNNLYGLSCDDVTCYYSPPLRQYRVIADNGVTVAEGHITLYKGIAGI